MGGMEVCSKSCIPDARWRECATELMNKAGMELEMEEEGLAVTFRQPVFISDDGHFDFLCSLVRIERGDEGLA